MRPAIPAQCVRFHADGTSCTNTTTNSDGWCRQASCEGFTRARAEVAPEITPRPPNPARTRDPDVHLDLDPDEAYDVQISQRAVDSFRFHHGGTAQEAEVQLRVMLEDFLRSSKRTSNGGYITLAVKGYRLVLSADGQSVTNYTSFHRERTWAQVRAGVGSRFPGSPKGRRRAAGDAPALGPVLTPGDVPAAVDPLTVHLTARVRQSYEKCLDLSHLDDDELNAEIRAALTSLPGGSVDPSRPRPGTLIRVDSLAWLVSDDARTIIGVKGNGTA